MVSVDVKPKVSCSIKNIRSVPAYRNCDTIQCALAPQLACHERLQVRPQFSITYIRYVHVCSDCDMTQCATAIQPLCHEICQVLHPIHCKIYASYTSTSLRELFPVRPQGYISGKTTTLHEVPQVGLKKYFRQASNYVNQEMLQVSPEYVMKIFRHIHHTV